MKTDFIEFRKKLDEVFFSMQHQNSVAYQLVDLTDLFQKIAAIYAFARTNKNTALQNPILFQIIESALHYGVCVQIRRLANGKQHNEISIFKTAQEIRSNCRAWSRQDFVTWDGMPYDSSNLRAEHDKEINRIVADWYRQGKSGGWLPIGRHEEVERRHNAFDRLSSTTSVREKTDVWTPEFPKHVLDLLDDSAGDVVAFANQYLAHRVHRPTERSPDFDVSLDKIEHAITSLWKCYNMFSSVFSDGYMTPNIIHSLDSFRDLGLPVADEELETHLINSYEKIKDRMEAATNDHARTWPINFGGKFGGAKTSND